MFFFSVFLFLSFFLFFTDFLFHLVFVFFLVLKKDVSNSHFFKFIQVHFVRLFIHSFIYSLITKEYYLFHRLFGIFAIVLYAQISVRVTFGKHSEQWKLNNEMIKICSANFKVLEVFLLVSFASNDVSIAKCMWSAFIASLKIG